MMELSEGEFVQFQRFIFDQAGITLPASKKTLVSSRLAKRVAHHAAASFGDYYRLLAAGDVDERRIAVDLLTTNETYFFREPKHFKLLRQLAGAAPAGAPFRVWSAACSSGEEPYSIAMTLAATMGNAAWEVLASDISSRVLAKARAGHYPLERTQHIPSDWLRRYCLRGSGPYANTLLVQRALRERVRFAHVNLNETLPTLGQFDIVFLRNVMIYFSADTKREVVARITDQLKPGGYLLIGHSESLNEISRAVEQVQPSVYRKP